MKTPLTEYWNLLETMEDYLKDGIRRDHQDPPVFGESGGCSDATETEEVTGAFGDGGDSLEAVIQEVSVCTGCGLSETRNKTVSGAGVTENLLVMIIGEAPGGDEDRTGQPFVGKAGQYLDKWMDSIGLGRDKNCFIGNIIKCRPPGNRDPYPEEMTACLPYLERQIRLLKPSAILTLGRIAAQTLIGSTEGIGRLRGKTYRYKGIPLIPTYHPSGVLRNPQYRAGVWDDLKRLKALIDSMEN